MVISRKLAASVFTTVLLTVIGYVVTRLGWHLSTQESDLVTSIVAIGAGAFAGWFVKEVPGLEKSAGNVLDSHTSAQQRADLLVAAAFIRSSPNVQADLADLKERVSYLTHEYESAALKSALKSAAPKTPEV